MPQTVIAVDRFGCNMISPKKTPQSPIRGRTPLVNDRIRFGSLLRKPGDKDDRCNLGDLSRHYGKFPHTDPPGGVVSCYSKRCKQKCQKHDADDQDRRSHFGVDPIIEHGAEKHSAQSENSPYNVFLQIAVGISRIVDGTVIAGAEHHDHSENHKGQNQDGQYEIPPILYGYCFYEPLTSPCLLIFERLCLFAPSLPFCRSFSCNGKTDSVASRACGGAWLAKRTAASRASRSRLCLRCHGLVHICLRTSVYVRFIFTRRFASFEKIPCATYLSATFIFQGL